MKVQALTNLIYKGTHYFKDVVLEIEDRHFAHLQNQNFVTQNITTPAKEEPKTDVSTQKEEASTDASSTDEKEEENDDPKDQLDDDESDDGEEEEDDPGEPSAPQAPIG
jgi:thiamine kinase-like enzyme